MTTIAEEIEKASFPSVFNGFLEIQRNRVLSVKTARPLKTQHFIRMRLKTPSVDIAPVKLYPYVKSKTQTQIHELASCFCPYQLYPYDTLCTYGVKQLSFKAFFDGRSVGIRTRGLLVPKVGRIFLADISRHFRTFLLRKFRSFVVSSTDNST